MLENTATSKIIKQDIFSDFLEKPEKVSQIIVR